MFYDTYALYQIARGDPNYKQYARASIKTTLLNLYELYYTLLKEKHTELARELFQRLLNSCIEIQPEDITTAAEIRLGKKQLSYIDALGYAISQRRKLQFLTGDQEFKTMEGVKFVK